MGLLDVLKWRRIELKHGDFWAHWFGVDNYAQEDVSAESSLRLAAFWSCVRLYSETVGTLPLGVFERLEDGGKRSRKDHELYRLLHEEPNADQTAVEFWEGIVASICLGGNAYARKEKRGSKIVSLHPVPFDVVTVRRDENGRLLYRYSEQGKSQELDEDDIFHVRGFGNGGDLGLSPVAYARNVLGLAMATDRSASRTFANGMRPSGWLVYKHGTLKKEQREQVQKNLIEPMTGAHNTGKIGVLEADFDWRQMTINPDDAQMIESRGFNVEEICRWLRVPPVLIGHSAAGQTMWGSGIEQIMLGWLKLGLRPYLTRLEQAIKRRLMTPSERRTMFAEFNVEGLLRGDSAARAAFYAAMTQNGIYTRKRCRELENEPPIDDPNADVLTVQSNLVPLSKLGEEREQPPENEQQTPIEDRREPLRAIEGGRA